MAKFIKLKEYKKVVKSGRTSIVKAADSDVRTASYMVEMVSQIQFSAKLPVTEKPVTYHEVRFTDSSVKIIDSQELAQVENDLASINKELIVNGKSLYRVDQIRGKSILRKLKGSLFLLVNQIKSVRLLRGLTFADSKLAKTTFFEVTMISGKKIVIDLEFNDDIEKAMALLPRSNEVIEFDLDGNIKSANENDPLDDREKIN